MRATFALRRIYEVKDMSVLEMLVRRRMQEEYAKGTSPERITRLLQEFLNGTEASQADAAPRQAPNSR